MRRIAVLLLVLAAALPSASSAADEFENARQLHRQGQRAEARARLDQHLEKQPRDARARFLKGVILSEENRRDEAIAVFTALTQDFPELPEPYNNLAVLYAGRGDYERARDALLMAIRTHPGYVTAHENLGDVYSAMARQEYEKTLELDRSNQAAQAKLALIRELLPTQKPASATPAAEAGAEKPVVQAAPAPSQAAPAGEPLSPAPPAGVEPDRLQASAPPPASEAKMDVSPASPALAAAAEVAAPRPGTPSAAASPASAPAQERIATVLQTVNDWAQAWTRADANAYLSFYAPKFRTPKGEPRARWEAARRADFSRLKGVSVKVTEPKATFRDATRASVTFFQDYSSATAKVTGRKTLELVREGERWLIEQETFVRR